MDTHPDPILEQWYRNHDSHTDFEIVALDEDGGLIEIQYFDGAIEELDLETWQELNLEPIEPPEDWTGPVDDVEPGDLSYADAPSSSRNTNPLDEVESKPRDY